MRVLMLSWEYPPSVVGGLGAHVANLCPELAQFGVQVYVLTPLQHPSEPEEITPEGIHVFRVPYTHNEHHSFFEQVMHANLQLQHVADVLYNQIQGFDIIHTHDWLTGSAAITLKQLWHVPLLATIHATERGRGQGGLHSNDAIQIDRMEYQVTYEAWRVIVCSQFMTHQLVETFQTPADKIDIIPNGVIVRPSPFASDEERLLFRRQYVPDDVPIIFFVGRIVFEKGLHILIDALPAIRQHVPAQLIIAGTGSYLDALRTQVAVKNLEPYVTFTGFISDEELNKFYHVASVTTFPSLYEPFGIVVLEAYVAKSPVVVSETGGLKEVVHANRTGLTAIPGNSASLAQAIVQTLLDTEQTQWRIQCALEDIATTYNWHNIAQQTLAIYTRIYLEWQASSWRKEPHIPPDKDEQWQLVG